MVAAMGVGRIFSRGDAIVDCSRDRHKNISKREEKW